MHTIYGETLLFGDLKRDGPFDNSVNHVALGRCEQTTGGTYLRRPCSAYGRGSFMQCPSIIQRARAHHGICFFCCPC